MKKALSLLLLTLLICLLSGCTTKEPEAAAAKVTQWPASDRTIHTNTELPVPERSKVYLLGRPELAMQYRNIDDIPVCELYPSGRKGLPMVFFLHESEQRKEVFLEEAVAFAQAGFYCVLMDLPGYGDHVSDNSIESIESAVLTADNIDLLLEYYRLSPNADSSRFALYGVSLGGSASYYYAVYGKHTPTALVISSAAADFRKMHQLESVRQGKVSSSQWEPEVYAAYCEQHTPYTGLEKLAALPLLCFHGELDEVINVSLCHQFEEDLIPLNGAEHSFLYDPQLGHAVSPSFKARIIPFLMQYMK